MEEYGYGTVQVDYQTEELYIVTIILKYQKKECFNNNNILYILLSDTMVLSTKTLWDLIWNGKPLIYEVISDWNGIWSILEENRYI